MASSNNPTISSASAPPAASTIATTLDVARQEQLKFYRRSPIFGQGDDFAGACKRVHFSSKFDPLLLGDEDKASTEWGFLPPEETLQFRLERGDFLWSHIEFEAPGGSPTHFAAWSSHM